MLYLAEVIADLDERARLSAARNEGINEGRNEGRNEGEKSSAFTIARNLLKRNRPLAEIAEDTGLSLDEIKKLAY